MVHTYAFRDKADKRDSLHLFDGTGAVITEHLYSSVLVSVWVHAGVFLELSACDEVTSVAF